MAERFSLTDNIIYLHCEIIIIEHAKDKTIIHKLFPISLILKIT